MSRVPIKKNGVYVRISDLHSLFTIPVDTRIYQWWTSGETGKQDFMFITNETTKILEQYLLMPQSVLYDWNRE